ncbi:MAG: SDR family oxidoreductase [Pseudoclavibacter sp.]|nr:SDR family oxidoreductase [Pseudoclavibacter sp.]
MKIAIIGGHGQIGLRLTSLLREHGHEVYSIIRNPHHAAEVIERGGEPRLLDLEHAHPAELSMSLAGADAVVFTAGAGPGSGAARKRTVDRDGAILTADAAAMAGVTRFLLVSSMGTGRPEAAQDEVFRAYLQAKAEADAVIRSRTGLEYTIVHPGTLVDEPGTGAVTAGRGLPHGRIPREDVARVLRVLLEERLALRDEFDLVGGDTAIEAALRAL